jgi:tetratricopeptide (TPR) repeat protein
MISVVGFAQSTEKVPAKPAPKPKPVVAPLPTDPAELLRLANAAFERGDWAKAIGLYDRLLQADPGNPVGTQRKDEAETNLQRQLAAKEEAKRQAEAQQEENARLAAERKKLPLYIATAKTLIQDKNWKGAEGYLAKIEAVEPNHPFLLQADTRNGRIEIRRDKLRVTLHSHANQKELDEAMTGLQSLSPNDPLIAESKIELRRDALRVAIQKGSKPAIDDAIARLQVVSSSDPLIAEANKQLSLGEEVETQRRELRAAMQDGTKASIEAAIHKLGSISPADPILQEAYDIIKKFNGPVYLVIPPGERLEGRCWNQELQTHIYINNRLYRYDHETTVQLAAGKATIQAFQYQYFVWRENMNCESKCLTKDDENGQMEFEFITGKTYRINVKFKGVFSSRAIINIVEI